MLIGIIIYGVKMDSDYVDLSWSFGLVIVGLVFTFAAGVISALQLRSSGVQI